MKNILNKLNPIQFITIVFLLLMSNFVQAQYLFQITGSSNLASVNTGNTFVYTINYSTAGNTTSGQNVVATINLPSNVTPASTSPFSSSISYPTSQVTSATYNSSTNVVTITYINPLPAGAAGQIQLSLKYSNGNTPNGYAPDIFTKVTFSNALSISPVYSDTINVNAIAANNFSIAKIKNSGGAINDLTIYRLNISNSGSSSAALTLTNPILIDTLAPGVEFVEATSFSGSNAPVYNPADRTITWTWTSGLFNTNYSGSAYVSVKYPNTSFALGNNVCNKASLIGNIPTLPLGNSTAATKTGNVCFGLAAPSASVICTGGGITAATANWMDKHVLSGTSSNSFANGWSNNGNTQLDSVILTYTIDKSVDVNTVFIGKLLDGLGRTSRDTVELRYKTNLNSTFTLHGTYIITNDRSVTITLPAGQYLTEVNFVIYGDLPIGGSQSLTYSGSVRSAAQGAKDGSAIVEGTTYNTSNPGDDGTLITNNSTGKYYYNGVATNYSNCNGVAEIFIPKPVFNTPNKTITNSSSNLRASDTINYRFSIQLGGNVNAQNVVVYDTLDSRLNFVAGSGSVVINGVTINPTVNGNIVIWSLGTVNAGATYTINFKAEIKPGTPANTIPNKIYISSSNALFPKGVNSNTNITVVTNIALVAYKGQNGCDSNFVYYPTNATTQEGGLVNYKITVKNQGNVAAKDLTLIDVFPFIGDTRGSQWFPNLVGPVTLSDPNSTVYYNTVSNPCYADFVPAVNMPSCNAPVWTLTPPMDITSVKAIKIVRNSNLPALDSIVFSWPMRVPIGTPSNVIMNNTIYYQVSRADMAGTTGRLLPAAPNQVGMVTSCSPVLGSIGNYVWFDANKNGLQDEAAANGINGVKIYLYGTGPDSVMGGGDDVLIDSTFSANDFYGNPGYYKFIELKSGKYYVNFQTNYSEFLVTPNVNQASQINGNSDAALGTGNSGLVTINTSASGVDKDNNTIDAGYYIKGSLGNYVWFDDNKNGLQDEPASNGINGQKVYLLKNTSGSTYVIIDSTITANDVLGNPGYYNFVIDVVGTYKVQFPAVVSTKILTTQNGSAGANGNSDPNTSTGLSNAIVMNLIGGGINQHNPTIDAGYKCNVATPTITGNGTGNGGGRCENGTNITLTSSPAHTYQWFKNNVALVGETNQTLATNNVSGSYTVIAYDTAGCNSGVSNAINVVTYPKPNPNFTPTDTLMCLGANTFTFNNNTTISSGTFNSSWNFGDNTTSSAVSPTKVYSSVGNYTVKLITSTSNGCVDSITKNVIVTNTLSSGGVIGSTEDFCGTFNPSLINNITLPTGGFGNLEYQWYYNLNNETTNTGSNGWVLISGANAATYDPGVISQTTYYIRMSRSVGCGDFTGSNVIAKIVRPFPAANFTINNAVQCLSQNHFNFTNTSVANATSITNNSWSFGDLTTDNVSSPTKTFGANGTYSVKLVTTNSYGCSDSITKSVYVGNPTAAFTYNNKCNGVIEFVNNSVNANDYEWIFSNGHSYCTNSMNSFNRTFVAGNQMVTLVAKNNGICTDTFSQMITILPNPVAIFSAYEVGCSRLVKFSNFSVGTSSYSWNFGDAALLNDTSDLENPIYTYNNDGSYDVKLVATSIEGCKDSLTTTVHVNSIGTNPTANFTIENLSTNCVNRYNFNNTSINAVSYQWIFSDGSSINSTNASKSFGAAGTYQVMLVAKSVTNCYDTIVKTVNVLSSSNGPIASFTPNKSQSCLANNSFDFNNTSHYVGNGWIPEYEWSFGDGTSNNQNTYVYNKHYDTSGIYTVRLIATGSNGCKDTAYQTIEILPSPSALFTAFTNCGMTANINNTSSNAVAYMWDFGDNNYSRTNDLTFNHTYNNQNWYNINLIAFGSNGCKDYASKTIIASVGQLPVALFGYDTIACSGAIKFRNLSTGAAEFNWNFGDGTPIAYVGNPIHAYAAAGVYTVTLTASNGQGCTSVYTFTVNAPAGQNVTMPVAGFMHTIGTCNNAITANDTSAYAGIRNWYFDGVSVGNFPWLNIPNPANGYHELKLVVSNGNCFDSISKEILIQSPPSGMFSYQASTCSRTVLFTTNTLNGNFFKWKFNDALAANDTAIGNIVSHTFSNNGSYVVSLEVTNLTGCTTVFYDTVIVNATNNPLNASFYFNNTNCNCVCSNKIKFVNTTTGNANNYLWNFGDGNTSTQISPNKGYASSGYFTATLTVSDNNGCFSTASAQVYVPATSKGASASFTVDNAIQCLAGNNFNFTNNSTFLGAGYNRKYYWDFGDGTVDSVNNFIFNKHYTAVGNYTVQLVAVGNDNCKDTITMVVQVKNSGCLNLSSPVKVYNPIYTPILSTEKTSTGIVEKSKTNSNWNLYPNPNTGSFTVTCNQLNNNTEVEVVDILGRTVKLETKFNFAENTISINCQNITTGNYFAIISESNGEKTRIKFNITK